jgi:hypothetical protein
VSIRASTHAEHEAIAPIAFAAAPLARALADSVAQVLAPDDVPGRRDLELERARDVRDERVRVIVGEDRPGKEVPAAKPDAVGGHDQRSAAGIPR